MFNKVYKYIGMLAIVLVLLGHHSFQAHAMEEMQVHQSHKTCESSPCDHEMNMDICEQIQSDEMQISISLFTLPEMSFTQIFEIEESFVSLEESENICERIPISYQQLARSHLSKV